MNRKKISELTIVQRRCLLRHYRDLIKVHSENIEDSPYDYFSVRRSLRKICRLRKRLIKIFQVHQKLDNDPNFYEDFFEPFPQLQYVIKGFIYNKHGARFFSRSCFKELLRNKRIDACCFVRN